jgi:D-psicose/D-tagatose/L-ribulose 3-epimerase
MQPQAFEIRDREVVNRYIEARQAAASRPPRRLRLSWSNWGFGSESLQTTARRLAKNRIPFIELHGNRYGPDLGYKTEEVRSVLSDSGITVAGVCGMAGTDNEFASNRPHVRQRAIDYFRRQGDFCKEVGGSYVLVVPGAVGRPVPFDANEFGRAAEGIRVVAEHYHEIGIRGAIEPIRRDEVSFCHTIADARRLIAAIDDPGVQHINGDLYHMLAGERHIGEAILEAGPLLINLHLADTNRRALGEGMLNVDVVLMALYAIGFDERECYCTPEPLGAGSNPYSAMHESPDPAALDELVARTAATFYEREAAIRAATDVELLERFGAGVAAPH